MWSNKERIRLCFHTVICPVEKYLITRFAISARNTVNNSLLATGALCIFCCDRLIVVIALTILPLCVVRKSVTWHTCVSV